MAGGLVASIIALAVGAVLDFAVTVNPGLLLQSWVMIQPPMEAEGRCLLG
jgi:hypothetical protein